METINQLKSQREFMLEFSKDPQEFLQRWTVSQARDLKTMTGKVIGSLGNGCYDDGINDDLSIGCGKPSSLIFRL